MVKKYVLILFTLFVSSTYAQENNVLTDSIDLDELLQYPKKNSLPVRKPVLQIQPVQIPTTQLDLKVNYWRNWVSFGINVNQAAFSDNWKGGGVNSIALGSVFNYKTDYTREGKNFTSEVIFQYGKLKNKGQLERKTNDRIFWDNKVSLKLSNSWNFFGSLNFESQFDNGYAYSSPNGIERRTLISRFMSPGYLTESLGLEYKPNKYFWLRLGTGTARQTFVLDTAVQNNYGVEPGKRFRNELAFQLVSNFEKDIFKNVSLKSRYSMFANYERLNNIDHRWDATLMARVNRFINTSLTTIVIYDDDADAKIQASQAIALGIIYKFPY